MKDKIKIGIIREGKKPSDSRVPLPPEVCAKLIKQFPSVDIAVQPSEDRCFKDAEYKTAGIRLQEDLSDRDILLGVKEVPIDMLIPDKIYLFFSHTIKEQSYNRDLLRAVLDKNIRLIDYECLVDDQHTRVIGFGRWAGIVGAYNGLIAWGKHTGEFDMPRMHSFKDYASAQKSFKNYPFKPFRTLLTGGGRVAGGAAELLEKFGLEQVNFEDYLSKYFEHPVFVQLDIDKIYRHQNVDEEAPFNSQDFFDHPDQYDSTFAPYIPITDLMVNGIYWDNRAPAFFSVEDMGRPYFNIGVIADITCDIAPQASIPSTLRASTIDDPFFGFDPKTAKECEPFEEGVIDMMTIDNLPNELPRDASMDFGNTLAEVVFPELLKPEVSEMLYEATIAVNGQLGEHYRYLKSYVATAKQ